MDEMELLVDLHLDGDRQGPGSADETLRALALAGLPADADLRLADIGCGTGASSLALAGALPGARIAAVDLFPAFLSRLEARARAAGLSDRIETVEASMDALPFAPGTFDAIWAEGAIYNMGFAAGVRAWRELLKPGGVLAVSEITWLTASRPAELQAHWQDQYAEIGTASAKMAVLEASGYAPIGYFPLSEAAWLDTYYRPLQARLPAFRARHAQSETAQAIADTEEAEIALYERNRAYVSYGFYIARRVD